MTSALRDPREVLADAVAPDGRDVVDVGSGDGTLARWLAGRGARVVGVEIGAEPLARARAAPAVAGERYLPGVAQSLPLGDATADAVVFMQSLHHVPVAAMGEALQEAARVLRPGGIVYVQEPLATGPLFEVLRLVDDETEVRAAAAAVLDRAGEHGLAAVERLVFDVAVRLAGFNGLRDRIVLADAGRAAGFAAHEAELRRRFDALAVPDPERPGRVVLHQPVRIDVLRRA